MYIYEQGGSAPYLTRKDSNLIGTSGDNEYPDELHRIQQMAHLGAWYLNGPSGESSWSDETYNIFGKEPDDFILNYENILECIHPADRVFVDETLAKSFSDSSPGSYELKYRIIHGKTDEERWVHQKFRNQKDDNGLPARAAGIIQDVTENENLLREYSKFYSAVRFARNPFIITDKTGKISYVNPQCEKFFRYDLSELRGQNALFFNADMDVYLDNGYTEDAYNSLMRQIRKNTLSARAGSWEGELISSTRDGRVRWVHAFIYAIREMNGGINSFVITLIDITREREKEEHDRIDIYNAIASLAEHRDNDTGKHMQRIGEFCYLISKKLGKPRIYSDDIRIFAPMHDIGKVGISDDILRAPRALTADEFLIMKTHTNIGFDILKNRSKLGMAADIAGNHHEKYNGSGYPAGISGTGIPLSARICAVADVYDALRTKRPYKEAFSEKKTIEIISDGAGTHFDPLLVNLLIENRIEFNKIYEELMD